MPPAAGLAPTRRSRRPGKEIVRSHAARQRPYALRGMIPGEKQQSLFPSYLQLPAPLRKSVLWTTPVGRRDLFPSLWQASMAADAYRCTDQPPVVAAKRLGAASAR